jgi:predicted permease
MVRGEPVVNTLMTDITFGTRMLARSRGLTVTAIVTLALGICAATTVFSWIEDTLLDPISGVSRTSDLLALGKGPRNESPAPPLSYPDLRDLREQTRSFSALLGYSDDWVTVTGTSSPERIFATLVSANFFDLLGVRPVLGRGFLATEEGAPGSAPVAVIAYTLWQTRYAGSAAVIGQTIELNRGAYTIVGVAPQGFRGCRSGLRQDMWIPLVMERALWRVDRSARRDADWLNVIGRLRPGVTPEGAGQELNTLMRRLAQQHPDSHTGPYELWLDPLWRSPFGANVYLASSLPLLLGMAFVVLVLACANVANLLLVRAIGRRREIAVRLSLGASRWHLMRQMLVESLLLALAGGALAVLLTAWTAGIMGQFFPPTSYPLSFNGDLDGITLLAALVFSIVTSVMAGILPALRSADVAPVSVLNEETGRGSAGARKARVASTLVVVQVALSLLLLTAAGVFVQSLLHARTAKPGFEPDHVVLTSIDLQPTPYSEAQRIELCRQLTAALAAVPGVERAALADWVPLTFAKRSGAAQFEGYEAQQHESTDTRYAFVSPAYFDTMRIPLRAGRGFVELDSDTSPLVAVINEELARRYWPGLDPLGKRLELRNRRYTVIGVARTIRHHRLTETPEPLVYLSMFQEGRRELVIHVRTSRDEQSIIRGVEQAVHGVNPDLPLYNTMTLGSAVRMASVFDRMAAVVVGTFGMFALLLAAIGIYGVLAYTAGQRTKEIGIRVALGAQRHEVFRLVVGYGLVLTATGVAIGLALSVMFARALRGMLVGVAEADLATLGVVTFVLTVVSLTACAVPAMRAASTPPTVALRHE